jgi:uncharacterized protein (TIGR00255 family)
MTIRSMTGFARTDGSSGAIGWHWEVRSVNGRGLDLRLRVPSGYDGLEPRIRDAVGKRVARGSLTVTLAVTGEAARSEIRLNEAALVQVLAAAERVRQLTGCDMPRADGVLGLRGVLEIVEATEIEPEREARWVTMLAGLDIALDALVVSREQEGQRLAKVFAAQLGEIERLTSQIKAAPGRSPQAVMGRLREQIARLAEQPLTFDQARLHQEAVMIATRIDIEEELTRLGSHIEAARALLGADEPVGRKLDFLTQEFNREANTVCSKTNDGDIQRAGLALKAVIDQMREQVQNIE